MAGLLQEGTGLLGDSQASLAQQVLYEVPWETTTSSSQGTEGER